jgi:hypothetical protein
LALGSLAKAVAALAPRLDAAEASSASRQVLDLMGKTNDSWTLRSLVKAVAALAPRLDAAGASAASRQALDLMGKTNNSDALRSLAEAVAVLEVQATTEEASKRTKLATSAIGHASHPMGSLAGLTALAKAAQPLPGRFTEQQLVDLLKMPTCQRPAREVIIRQLGYQCGRPFGNLWEFVDWAREHRPDLDLTSPPIRPTLLGSRTPHD